VELAAGSGQARGAANGPKIVSTRDDAALNPLVEEKAKSHSGDVPGARGPPTEATKPIGEVEEGRNAIVFSGFGSRTGKCWL